MWSGDKFTVEARSESYKQNLQWEWCCLHAQSAFKSIWLSSKSSFHNIFLCLCLLREARKKCWLFCVFMCSELLKVEFSKANIQNSLICLWKVFTVIMTFQDECYTNALLVMVQNLHISLANIFLVSWKWLTDRRRWTQFAFMLNWAELSWANRSNRTFQTIRRRLCVWKWHVGSMESPHLQCSCSFFHFHH